MISKTLLSVAALAFSTFSMSLGCSATPSPMFVGFDTGDDAPSKGEDDQVKHAISAMKGDDDLHLVIIGHADARGTDALNDALSLRRARYLRAAIVGEGISKTRIQVAARGDDDPSATNATMAGRTENRRSELFFFYPKNGDASAQVGFKIQIHDE